MKKFIVSLPLLFLALTGCGNSNNPPNTLQKITNLEEVNNAQNEIIHAQNLIQQKKYVDAQSIWTNLSTHLLEKQK